MGRPRSYYIPLYASVYDDKKTLMCADDLDVTPHQLVGHLASLWIQMLIHHGTDDLSDVPDSVIARWAGWSDDASEFCDALRLRKWIKADDDERMCAAGWRKLVGPRLKRIEDKRRHAAAKRDSQQLSIWSADSLDVDTPNKIRLDNKENREGVRNEKEERQQERRERAKEFADFCYRTWEQKHKQKPIWRSVHWQKLFTAYQDLNYDDARARAAWTAYLACDDKWVSDHDPKVFHSKLNKWSLSSSETTSKCIACGWERQLDGNNMCANCRETK